MEISPLWMGLLLDRQFKLLVKNVLPELVTVSNGKPARLPGKTGKTDSAAEKAGWFQNSF
jgi:hypothetical protein